MTTTMTAEEIAAELRAQITGRAREYLQRGGRIGQLAKLADVAHVTIANMIYGDTTRPQLATTLRIAVALGVRIRIDAPADLKSASRQRRAERQDARAPVALH